MSLTTAAFIVFILALMVCIVCVLLRTKNWTEDINCIYSEIDRIDVELDVNIKRIEEKVADLEERTTPK